MNVTVNPKLPVMAILSGTLAYMRVSWRGLAALALLPVVSLAFITTLAESLAGGSLVRLSETGAFQGLHPLSYPLMAAFILFSIIFTVACYRQRLLPQRQESIAQALMWDRYKTRFLQRYLLIALMILGTGIAVAVPVAVMATLLVAGGGKAVFASLGVGFTLLATIAFLVPMLLVFGRAALWLPAATVDDPRSLGMLWASTRGNAFRLAAFLIVPQIPFFALQLVTGGLLAALAVAAGLGQSLTFSLLTQLTELGINYASIAASTSALAAAYEQMAGGGRRAVETQ